MKIKALWKQVGDYGTVIKGEIIEVSDEQGKKLIAGGNFEAVKETKKAK